MKISVPDSSESKQIAWGVAPANARILANLLQAQVSARLHHAFIFSGPVGVGKMNTALTFAAQLLTAPSLFGAGDPEQTLARLLRKNHPDFLLLEPEDGSIRVEQVRELQKALAYSPLEAPWRVLLISEAQEMNMQAANAILKILEEPPPQTVFFLLVQNSLQLLPTIRSRCQEVRFPPLSSQQIAAEFNLSAEDSLAAEGSIARGQKLILDQPAAALRLEAAQMLLELWKASPRIPSAALSFVERIAAEDATAEIVVDAWNAIVRDAALVAADAETDFYFPTLLPAIRALQDLPKWTSYRLSSKLQLFYRFREQRNANVNLRLAMEALLLGLQLQ
jgi:DNA polymerase-3 subunit delta'